MVAILGDGEIAVPQIREGPIWCTRQRDFKSLLAIRFERIERKLDVCFEGFYRFRESFGGQTVFDIGTEALVEKGLEILSEQNGSTSSTSAFGALAHLEW